MRRTQTKLQVKLGSCAFAIVSDYNPIIPTITPSLAAQARPPQSDVLALMLT